MLLRFATNSYKSRSLPVSAQRCVNMYAEAQPVDAKTQISIIGAPGLVSFATCGSGPVRGMHVMAGVLYVVSGSTLYSVSSAGVATAVGGSVSGTGVVSMADNGTQLCIVNGTLGYIYSTASGFQLITSVNFHAAKTVTFFDTFFVFDWDDTSKVFVSAANDGLTYSALAFQSAIVQPDNVISIVNQQENLFIFGQTNIETWYDAGAFPFPFQRYDGATIERGCAAALSSVKEDNSVFFLGDDLIFYRLNGIIPVRVSTHAIESAWRSYSTTSDAFTFSYTFEGHKFVVLTFPTALATWVYDISTNLWHERESWDENNNTLSRWRVNCYANCYAKDLVGDAINGTVGQLSATTYTEYGNVIRALLISPPIHSDRKRIFHSALELDMETGVGLNSGQGSDPQVMLDWSDNGGRSYSSLQPWNSLGSIGEYTKRLRWLRLGQARQRIYRVSITDPVKRTLIAAHASLSVGM